MWKVVTNEALMYTWTCCDRYVCRRTSQAVIVSGNELITNLSTPLVMGPGKIYCFLFDLITREMIRYCEYRWQ